MNKIKKQAAIPLLDRTEATAIQSLKTIDDGKRPQVVEVLQTAKIRKICGEFSHIFH